MQNRIVNSVFDDGTQSPRKTIKKASDKQKAKENTEGPIKNVESKVVV